MKILITGGAGFVGSNIAIYLKKKLKGAQIYSLDNLMRMGSIHNAKRLQKYNIKNYSYNIENFKKINRQNKKFNIFIAYYIKNTRLIDNI